MGVKFVGKKNQEKTLSKKFALAEMENKLVKLVQVSEKWKLLFEYRIVFDFLKPKIQSTREKCQKPKIRKISGVEIFQHIIDYPIDDLKIMLQGGLNANEFSNLQCETLDNLHDIIDTQLSDKGVNTKAIHTQLNTLFKSVPNAAQENRLLEKEVIPIRVMLRVEDAPVTQIDYKFKERDYSLWVFGNENKVWYQSIPFSFNYKLIVIFIASIVIIGLSIINYL